MSATETPVDAPAELTSAPRRSSRSSAVKAAAETGETAAPSKKRKAAAGTGDDDKVAKTKKAKAKAGGEEDAGDEAGAEKETEHEAGLTAIDIGDSLPSFVLKNEKDEDVDVATLTAEKGLVLFLVPRADTPGCTTQACGFRDSYPDFTGLDYSVYCLSADKPAAQSKWQTKKELPYPLLSDPQRVLISALGAGAGGKTKRSHFIFEKGGKLVERKVPVKAGESPKIALAFIKSRNQ